MTIELEIKKELNQGLESIKSQIKTVTEDVDARIKNINDAMEAGKQEKSEDKEEFQKSNDKLIKLEKSFDLLSNKIKSFNSGGSDKEKTIGQIAAENERAKNYEGGNMVLANVNSSVFKISTPLAEGVVQSQHLGIKDNPSPAFNIRSLMNVLTTVESSIDFAQPIFTNNSYEQFEEGDSSPSSQLRFEKKTASVATITNWLPASRQVLADARGLANFIDKKLKIGLAQKEEEQVLLGDGMSGKIVGIVPQASAFSADSGDQQLDSLRKMILKVMMDSDAPADAIVLNPEDWAAIELLKTNDNAYLFSNPQSGAEARLWGKRVVESKGLPVGDGLVGSFLYGATLWDREQVTVRVAEQHSNFFLEQMVAILCEERIALTVELPNAFTAGSLLSS